MSVNIVFSHESVSLHLLSLFGSLFNFRQLSILIGVKIFLLSCFYFLWNTIFFGAFIHWYYMCTSTENDFKASESEPYSQVNSSSYEGWLNLSEKAFQFRPFQEARYVKRGDVLSTQLSKIWIKKWIHPEKIWKQWIDDIRIITQDFKILFRWYTRQKRSREIEDERYSEGNYS